MEVSAASMFSTKYEMDTMCPPPVSTARSVRKYATIAPT
jgi:hypothetical protein